MRFPPLFLGLIPLGWVAAFATLPEGLPGEEVSLPTPLVGKPPAPAPHSPDSGRGLNWWTPSVEEQLSNDQTLLTLGKGAIFVPCFSESRREPEVTVLSPTGRIVATGQTGHRILVDSGEYQVRYGSGVTGRRLSSQVRVEEGRTVAIAPTWGGLLVETLTEDGQYIDGQYDLVRMERWVSYGRGSGFKEERLQDIKVWTLPPGLYRLSKVGESYNSLKNYITVQINPAELHTVELIFDKAIGGELVAGGIKSLNTRTKVGRNWTYGLRAGGNLGWTQSVDNINQHLQSTNFSTDLRLRARYEKPTFFGINELFLQNTFLKENGKPINTTLDDAQLRSTWVRRLNTWVGPYVRGEASTHFFPTRVSRDSLFVLQTSVVGDSLRYDSTLDTSRNFRAEPPLFPLNLAEGAGVNVEWLSLYQLELSTQVGIGAHQNISHGDYSSPFPNTFQKSTSTYLVGAEGLLIGKLRISNQFTLDLRAELFAENGQPKNLVLQHLEADFRLFLARNLEIGYLFQLDQISGQVANNFPRSQILSLRLNFNY